MARVLSRKLSHHHVTRYQTEGKIRGTFHKTALKKYLREPGGELIYMYKNMLIGDNSRSERNISDCN